MAGEAPIYRSQQSSRGVGQVAPVATETADRAGAAAGHLGQSLAMAGQAVGQFAEVQRQVDLHGRRTRYLEGLDALQQSFQNDPDPATAAQRFDDQAKGLAAQATQGLSPTDGAAVSEWMTRQRLTDTGQVRRHSLGRQQQQFSADLTTTTSAYLKRFNAAASPAERQAATTDYHGIVDDGVARGVIAADRAAQLKQAFGASGEEALWVRAANADPARAMAEIRDPTKWTAFDPVQREQKYLQAQQLSDERATLRLQAQAQFDPPGAAATLGRAGYADAGRLYEKAFGAAPGVAAPPSPQASAALKPYLAAGRDAGHVDNLGGGFAGALQQMFEAMPPDIRAAVRIGSGHRSTERQAQLYQQDVERNGGTPSGMVAPPGRSNHEKGGAADLQYDGKGRPDSEAGRAAMAWVHENAGRFGLDFRLLKSKGASIDEPWHIEQAAGAAGAAGTADPRRAAFFDGMRQTAGSVPAALAFVHAGAAALPVYEEAKRRYGDNFTPAQFMALLPAETAAQVRASYARLGADANGPGLSVNAAYRASAIVQAAGAQQRAEEQRALAAMVAAGKEDRDQTIANFWDGYRVDAAALQRIRAPLVAAAAAGDATAIADLRKIDVAAQAAPAIAEARAMHPAELAARLDAEKQSFLTAPPSAFQQRRHDAMQKVADAHQKAMTEFPVELLRGQGVAPVIALDPGAPAGDPGFARALTARGAQADAATRLLPGAPLKVFDAAETAAFKAKAAQASDEDRLGFLRGMAQALSPDAYRAAVGQIFGDDPTMRVAGLVAAADPGLARDVLRGKQLLDLPEMKEKGADLREALKRVAPVDLWEHTSGAQMGDAIQAALAVYASERGRQGVLFGTPDRAGLEAALTRVVGERVSRGGRQVATPRGLPASAFTAALDNLTASDLAPFGGASWSVDPKPGRDAEAIDPQWLGREASLHQIALGSDLYGVRRAVGGGRSEPVFTADGRPLVLDMRALVSRRNARPADPAQTRRDMTFTRPLDAALIGGLPPGAAPPGGPP